MPTIESVDNGGNEISSENIMLSPKMIDNLRNQIELSGLKKDLEKWKKNGSRCRRYHKEHLR